MCSALAFAVTSWAIQLKGPLYVSVFTPLLLVIVAITSWALLREKLYVGTYVYTLLTHKFLIYFGLIWIYVLFFSIHIYVAISLDRLNSKIFSWLIFLQNLDQVVTQLNSSKEIDTYLCKNVKMSPYYKWYWVYLSSVLFAFITSLISIFLLLKLCC